MHLRILSRLTESSDGCWVWDRPDFFGYGNIEIGNRGYKVHRLMYEAYLGPIPDGLVIDHLCRNRACANPAHMEPVTIAENVMRGVGAGAKFARRTSGACGHPFSPENTITRRDGGRRCRACKLTQNRAYKARKRARKNVQAAESVDG